jgi:hypothetical protein
VFVTVWEIYAAIAPQADDIVVENPRISALFGSGDDSSRMAVSVCRHHVSADEFSDPAG